MTTAATIVGAFVFGVPSIIAVVINDLKRPEAKGTFLESHFRWQIRTFWFGLLWILLCFCFVFVTLGIGLIMVAAVFPVAIQLEAFGTFALIETIVFIVLLFIAFVYVWRRGALEWR